MPLLMNWASFVWGWLLGRANARFLNCNIKLSKNSKWWKLMIFQLYFPYLDYNLFDPEPSVLTIIPPCFGYYSFFLFISIFLQFFISSLVSLFIFLSQVLTFASFLSFFLTYSIFTLSIYVLLIFCNKMIPNLCHGF